MNTTATITTTICTYITHLGRFPAPHLADCLLHISSARSKDNTWVTSTRRHSRFIFIFVFCASQTWTRTLAWKKFVLFAVAVAFGGPNPRTLPPHTPCQSMSTRVRSWLSHCHCQGPGQSGSGKANSIFQPCRHSTQPSAISNRNAYQLIPRHKSSTGPAAWLTFLHKYSVMAMWWQCEAIFLVKNKSRGSWKKNG